MLNARGLIFTGRSKGYMDTDLYKRASTCSPLLRESDLRRLRLVVPETYRGKRVVYGRCSDWDLIDYTNRWVRAQRSKCVGPCTPYWIPMAWNILDRFRPSSWLDPTAGWGERLLAALLMGPPLRTYVGIDLNAELQPIYHKIIEEYKRRGSKDIVEVRQGRMQDVMRRMRRTFDLVFTSPPFYNTDVYEGMTPWKSVQEYVSDFLLPLVNLSYERLNPGGHLVLYIMDHSSKGIRYIDALKEAARKAGFQYEGVIYYQGRVLRPHYVWRKPS